MIEYRVRVYNNNTIWYNTNGELHRENGPAIEFINGDNSWWKNGKIHREDGPAIECANGDKEWWLNGKKHREDGPASEFNNGNKSWWINGKKLSEEEFLRITRKETTETEVTMDEIAEKFNMPVESLKIKKD